MKEILIHTKTDNYPILIGSNFLTKLHSFTQKYDKILFLTNDTLFSHYSNLYEEKIASSKTEYYVLPDGEQYKNLDFIQKIYNVMLEKHFSRKSCILCFGGGVVCDMGGFVAASFMRGIDFIQIPTSLLAQVDASIGGKVAVNHPFGKNLIGFFYSPKAVLIDVSLLHSLHEVQFQSGMSEVIKHSILCPNDAYSDFLVKNQKEIQEKEEATLISLIEQSCQIKKYYVEEDMQEKGIRAFLNFGHTYAHALENLYHYEHISHGEAVAKGCLLDLFTSYQKGLLPLEYFEKIKNLFDDYSIDSTPVLFPFQTLWEAMEQDKKNAFSKINTVYLKKQENKKEFLLQELDKQATQGYLSQENHYETKAVIDIGTNSCRLYIAEWSPKEHKIIKHLYQEVQIVQLGEKVNETKFLQESAIKRTLDCLIHYQNIIKQYACSTIYCFATSATRDAHNREYFIQKVLKNIGIQIHCIPGETEAEYNFRGVSLAIDGQILIVDIGGGSTEFTLGNHGEILFSKSLNMGAVRATELFFQEENYSFKNIQNCKHWILEQLKEIETIRQKDFVLIGVAGTATTQVSVAKKMKNYTRELVHLSEISNSQLEQNLSLFLSKSLEERKKIIGLEAKRANVIIAGTIILQTIFQYLGKETMTISEFDNLMGAMIL